MAFKIGQKKKFGKTSYKLSEFNTSYNSEPIMKHSAQDWRKVGYKARAVQLTKNGIWGVYLNEE